MKRVPAEWEPQQCLWLAWPHNRETWPGRFDRMPPFFARWIAVLAESIPVRVLVQPDTIAECRSLTGGITNVTRVEIATNDCWLRDYGPTFVLDEPADRMVGVSWRYNAWGGKYPPWDLDAAAAREICEDQAIPCVESQMSLEGGAIEVDGGGRLITTPECLVTQTRNPGWQKSDIETELQRQLGVNEIVWLTGGGLAGDDTDGHIDQLARFIDRGNLVAAVCDDPADENHAPLEENYRQLCRWGESTSPRVEIHRLPIPPARKIDGQRVPESYCNFLWLGGERLLLPTFAADTDERALGLLGELTTATIEPIDCRDLVWGLGALHCASRDQPLG